MKNLCKTETVSQEELKFTINKRKDKERHRRAHTYKTSPRYNFHQSDNSLISPASSSYYRAQNGAPPIRIFGPSWRIGAWPKVTASIWQKTSWFSLLNFAFCWTGSFEGRVAASLHSWSSEARCSNLRVRGGRSGPVAEHGWACWEGGERKGGIWTYVFDINHQTCWYPCLLICIYIRCLLDQPLKCSICKIW